MDSFLYAMTESFNRMQEEIHKILNISEYTEKQRNQLFLAVGSCLHCILDYAERVNVDKQDKELKDLLSAFRYANNSLKHNIEVRTIAIQRGGVAFPIHFPLEIPRKEVVWSIKDNNGNKFENQRNKYEELLRGKDVIKMCRKIIDMLREYEL